MGAERLSSRAIRGLIQQSLAKATPDPWVMRLGQKLDSDQDSETYKWLSEIPVMRKWKGKRNVSDFVDYGITVVNEKFEATIQIDLDEMRRDKIGQLRLRISELGRRAQTHWSTLCANLIVANPTAYDGKAFFASDHQELDSGTQDNDLGFDVVNTAAVTAAEMKNAILQSVQTMLGYKDGVGEPIAEDARKFMILVPLALWHQTVSALGNSVIVESGGAVTNTLAHLGGFQFELEASARLSSADTFYTFRTDTAIPTVIRQEEKAPKHSGKTEGSDFEHDFDMHEYGVSANRAVAPGRWQNASRTILV